MNHQQTEEGLIGISVRDTVVRMTETITSGQGRQIVKVVRGSVRYPMELTSLEKSDFAKVLSDDINRLYEMAGMRTTRAAISLDSDMVLIKKIPLDANLEGEELREHIHWEVSQYVINPIDHFNIGYQTLNVGTNSEYERAMVLVLIRKQVVESIKELFAGTSMQLRAIDVDIFSAQRVIETTYNFEAEKKVALVDIRKKNVQLSILYNDYYLSQEVGYPIDEDGTFSTENGEHLARIISKELRRVILDNKLGKSIEDMHEILLYGDAVDDVVIETLSSAHAINIRKVNPFEKITIIATPEEQEVTDHPEAYVTSVGVAIKGL
ncbi:MAG TPA: hypothetical protein ENJ29_13285 [Bacteroidetes bacterium]|nr:hypothetical protein [Bacteroidota bacterium]